MRTSVFHLVLLCWCLLLPATLGGVRVRYGAQAASVVKVTGDDIAIVGTTVTLTATVSDPEQTLLPPYDYRWQFSADSLTWTDLDATTAQLRLEDVDTDQTGWYRLRVTSQNCTSDRCTAYSAPHYLDVIYDSELCFGTLLFREDFGGNSPDDPFVGQESVATMQDYTQLKVNRYPNMGGGRYLLTKSGYCNGDTSNWGGYRGSQWHLMDDHTYPEDKTRGYLLQVDGKAGNHIFYQTGIGNLCENSVLTFSVYAVNVVTWVQWLGSPYFALPNLKFEIANPYTNELIGVYETGPIPSDSTLYKQGTPEMFHPEWRPNANRDWCLSAHWNQYAFTLPIPQGLDSVVYTIRNNAKSTTGNDFAMDDIEIWLCAPTVQIEGVDTLCAGETSMLTARVTRNRSFIEPFDYLWEYSPDSLNWTTYTRNEEAVIGQASAARHNGWYRLTVSSEGTMDSKNCKAYSRPFHLTVMPCQPTYDTAYVSGCDSVQYKGRTYYSSIAFADTVQRPWIGDSIHLDSLVVWHSTTGSLPLTGKDSLQHCSQWFYRDTVLTDTLTNSHGCDSLLTVSLTLTYTPAYDTTYYSACDSVFYREHWYYASCSVNDTTPRVHTGDSIHTAVLTVLRSTRGKDNASGVDSLNYQGVWYNRDTAFVRQLTNAEGCDSLVSVSLTLTYTPTFDTTYLVGCDSVMYNNRWYYADTKNTYTITRPYKGDHTHTDIVRVRYSSSFDYQMEGQDSVWFETRYLYRDTVMTWHLTNAAGCDSTVYFHVDVIPSGSKPADDEGIEDLIVNKYDWIIVLNNRRLRMLFPNHEPESFVWLKNGQPQPWYKRDYYTEDRLLDGTFQMVLNIAGQTVRSNIIVVNQPDAAPRQTPKQLRDGRLFIYHNGNEYNAQGIRIR